jgi:hypothetical protein
MTADTTRPLPTVREIERALRRAGCSRAQAKALVADGIAALGPCVTNDAEVADALRHAARSLRASEGA